MVSVNNAYNMGVGHPFPGFNNSLFAFRIRGSGTPTQFTVNLASFQTLTTPQRQPDGVTRGHSMDEVK